MNKTAIQYTETIPPTRVTQELYAQVEGFRQRQSQVRGQVITQSEVLRRAIEAAMHTDLMGGATPRIQETGKYTARITTTLVTPEQLAFLRRMAVKDMTNVSQVVRNILAAYATSEREVV